MDDSTGHSETATDSNGDYRNLVSRYPEFRRSETPDRSKKSWLRRLVDAAQDFAQNKETPSGSRRLKIESDEILTPVASLQWPKGDPYGEPGLGPSGRFMCSLELMPGVGTLKFGVNGAGSLFRWLTRTGTFGGLRGGVPASVSAILRSQKRGADDIIQKGVHYTVEGIEVAIRPDHKGSLVIKRVFGTTTNAQFESARRTMKDALRYEKVRKALFEYAKVGFEHAKAMKSPKALEFKMIMQALANGNVP